MALTGRVMESRLGAAVKHGYFRLPAQVGRWLIEVGAQPKQRVVVSVNGSEAKLLLHRSQRHGGHWLTGATQLIRENHLTPETIGGFEILDGGKLRISVMKQGGNGVSSSAAAVKREDPREGEKVQVPDGRIGTVVKVGTGKQSGWYRVAIDGQHPQWFKFVSQAGSVLAPVDKDAAVLDMGWSDHAVLSLHVVGTPPTKPHHSRQAIERLKEEARNQMTRAGLQILRGGFGIRIKYRRAEVEYDAANIVGGIADALTRIVYRDDRRLRFVDYAERQEGGRDEYWVMVEPVRW